jgi:2,5-diamino-6-(ribosylamino)-4(3H)-pyrimidinone 5'-phosphate reductase
MLPHVVIHNEISVDARMDRLNVDMGRFYRLAATWKEDVTLVGADTILASMPELADAAAAVEMPSVQASDPTETSPLLAVVDGRGRLPGVAALRAQPYWRDVVVLCSEAAPGEHLAAMSRQGVDHLVAGTERVDLRAALQWLAERHSAGIVRVDAGGTLIGALLRAGLVDEVSVLVEPRLIGGESRKWLFQAPDTAADDVVVPLRLQHLERFDDDVIWTRYEVVRSSR